MNIKHYEIDKLNYCKVCNYNCEIVCPVYKATKDNELTPKNKAVKALKSLKEWNFSDNNDFYACINCKNCTAYCMHKNEVAEVLSYAREKTLISNNASRKIYEFEEDFYNKVEKIKFIQENNITKIKNIPDFLTFYNIGFRDETITELKAFLRNIKTEKAFIDDISIVYLINNLKKYFKKIKTPEFLFNQPERNDYIKIVLSGLEISKEELYKILIREFKNQ